MEILLWCEPLWSGNLVRPQCLRIEVKLNYAARQGFEPRLTVPETAVLPLDDRAMCFVISYLIL